MCRYGRRWYPWTYEKVVAVVDGDKSLSIIGMGNEELFNLIKADEA
jgi:hypothetical protein